MQFELTLAWRHLTHGKVQSLLTIGAVSVAVIVVVFFQSVMNGVIKLTINDAIGSQPHVVVRPPDQRPRLLSEIQSERDGHAILASAVDKQISQRKDVENPRQLEAQLAGFPGVSTLASTVKGNAFLIRGAKRLGASVIGGDPAALERIYRVQKYMVAGQWVDIGPDRIVMGWRLAEDCGVRLGDRVRIESSEGVTATFIIAGLFDAGVDGLDRGRIYVSLRAAQSLFAMQENVSQIDVKLVDPFQANDAADAIAAALPYKTDSWIREQPQVESAVGTQTGVRNLISGFALVSSAFAIASVLIVSVIQKSKQIGILKSIGARDSQILRVFIFQGLLIAIAGCILGCVVAYVMVSGFSSISTVGRFGRVKQVLPVVVDPNVFAIACGAATLSTLIAAALPAWRASKLDPVEAIRS